MSLDNTGLPLDELAGLNQNGEMTKLLVAPLIILAAAVALIALARWLQKLRDRRMLRRFYGE